MIQKASRPVPLATVTSLGIGSCSAALSYPEHNAHAYSHQVSWLVARFGLAADRARLTAELAFTIGGGK